MIAVGGRFLTGRTSGEWHVPGCKLLVAGDIWHISVADAARTGVTRPTTTDSRQVLAMAGPALDLVNIGDYFVDNDYAVGYISFRIAPTWCRAMGVGWPSPLILTFSPEGEKGPEVTAVIEVLFFDIATKWQLAVGSWELGAGR